MGTRNFSGGERPMNSCGSASRSWGRRPGGRAVVPYLVPLWRIMAITASEARKNLFPLIARVNDDRQPVEITSKHGDAVLMSRADYDALTETARLLRVPANAQRLMESLAQARSGQREAHDLR